MITAKDIIKWCMDDWISNSAPKLELIDKERFRLQMSILACIMIREGYYYG